MYIHIKESLVPISNESLKIKNPTLYHLLRLDFLMHHYKLWQVNLLQQSLNIFFRK